MSQISNQLPIKEYGTSLERLEKENFDLKLQISHLKSKLNELTNSSLTFMPVCDCKKTKTETNGVLNEVKREMENLLETNQEIRNENAQLKNKIEEVFEENGSLRKDCIRLSQHITEKTRQESEYKKVFGQMKEEVEIVKEEMEEMEKIKMEKIKIEEELAELRELTKKTERDYKEDLERLGSINTKILQRKDQLKEMNQQMAHRIEESAKNNHQLTTENYELSSQNQKLFQEIEKITNLVEELQKENKEKTEEMCKTKEIGEKLVNEMKIKNKKIQTQKEEIEKKAGEIIRDREVKIVQLQVHIQKIHTEAQHNLINMNRIQATADEYIRKVGFLTGKVEEITNEIENIRGRTNALLEQYKAQILVISMDKTKEVLNVTQRDKERLEHIVKEAKQEMEKVRKEKERLSVEREDLAKRLHITQSTLQIAKELGVNDFTTINNLFLTWKKSNDALLQERDNEKRAFQKEEQERSRKLEEFQTKLYAALSELSICRAYLEEKKSIIKSIKKQGGTQSILRKIDVSH